MIGDRHVYFMRQQNESGPVKIGTSDDPYGRLRTYMAWCPYPMEIIAVTQGGLEVERRFHALFRHLHSHSEWFHWAPEIEAMVKLISDGRFRLNMLPPPQRLPSKINITPESIRARENSRRITRLGRQGVAIPYEVQRALSTYRCMPDERDRRRAFVQAWLDQHDRGRR